MSLSYHDVYGSPWVDDQSRTRARLASERLMARPRQYEIARDASPTETIALAKLVLADAGVKAEVVRKSPTWRPGDVVVVFYGPHRTPYTYVRGRETWPTDEGRQPKTDEFMTAQLDAGRLKPVLQSGGEPFDGGRL
ncbi:hypothetical protein DER29_0490 [Micromonospora sp. M71_S20]|uniref:hypothetical protein n=1 Tax=Micromonospora sp. M71_S20 TaxID=592872 RepID=UPI000EB43771|nr:hypothetical protein [Micromonospora sp. M71_S20]RLK22652.1 hypothetical protein DER29_0490 [Micromonospora sp. M71_S20]